MLLLQVYKGRHRLRDVAIKVLQLEPGLATAVQREVTFQTLPFKPY